jgi:hypothetical protein
MKNKEEEKTKTIIESPAKQDKKEEEATDARKWLKSRFSRFIVLTALVTVVLICAYVLGKILDGYQKQETEILQENKTHSLK